MNPGPAAKRAHDALLELAPAGSVHEPCELCPDPIKKEVAEVPDNDRTYTEVEHLALMADAVTRETAALADAKVNLETELSEKAARVDVLEAEKASLETAKVAAETELAEFRAGIEALAAIEAAKADRVTKVKAANAALTDEYFTDERIQRWAEMTEEAFLAFVADITALPASPAKETAAFSGGESPTGATTVTAGSIFAARRGKTA